MIEELFWLCLSNALLLVALVLVDGVVRAGAWGVARCRGHKQIGPAHHSRPVIAKE
jgi:hypothetical protein